MAFVLFVVAALAEIGGAWLIWQGLREHRGAAHFRSELLTFTTGNGQLSVPIESEQRGGR